MRPLGLTAQPERPREIEDPQARAHERRPHFRRQRVGHRQKHRVGFLGQAIDIEPLNRARPKSASSAGTLLGSRGARTHRQADVHMRVLSQPPQQFHAGVAGRSGDADPDSRITIHPNH